MKHRKQLMIGATKRLFSLVLTATLMIAIAPNVTRAEGASTEENVVIDPFIVAEPIQVAQGTAVEDIPFPELTYDSGQKTVSGVVWACEEYDARTPATYTFTASLPDGYHAAQDEEPPSVLVEIVAADTTDGDDTTADEADSDPGDSRSPTPTVIDPFAAPEPIQVEQGTAVDDIPFPKLTYVSGQKTVEGVTWVCTDYDADTPGTYIFTATLPEGYEVAPDREPPSVLVEVVGAATQDTTDGEADSNPSDSPSSTPTVIDSFTAPEPIRVEQGTVVEDIPFPELTYDSGQKTVEGVTWACDDYDADTPEAYTFTATLPEGYGAAQDEGQPSVVVEVIPALAMPSAHIAANNIVITSVGYNCVTKALYVYYDHSYGAPQLLINGVVTSYEANRPVPVGEGYYFKISQIPDVFYSTQTMTFQLREKYYVSDPYTYSNEYVFDRTQNIPWLTSIQHRDAYLELNFAHFKPILGEIPWVKRVVIGPYTFNYDSGEFWQGRFDTSNSSVRILYNLIPDGDYDVTLVASNGAVSNTVWAAIRNRGPSIDMITNDSINSMNRAGQKIFLRGNNLSSGMEVYIGNQKVPYDISSLNFASGNWQGFYYYDVIIDAFKVTQVGVLPVYFVMPNGVQSNTVYVDFYDPRPAVTGVSHTSIPPGETTVTIRGKHFSDTLTMTLNAMPYEGFRVIDDGTVEIDLTYDPGNIMVSSFSFELTNKWGRGQTPVMVKIETPPVPVIESISTHPYMSTEPAVIKGTNFSWVKEVMVGTTRSVRFQVYSDTEILFWPYEGGNYSPGTFTVNIIDSLLRWSNGKLLTMQGPPPIKIISASPLTYPDGPVTVSVHLENRASLTNVYFDNQPVTDWKNVGSDIITFDIDPDNMLPNGDHTVSVYSMPTMSGDSKTIQKMPLAPVVDSITPNPVNSDYGGLVTITGQNLHYETVYDFDGMPVTIKEQSRTKIVFDCMGEIPGTYTFSLRSTDGTQVLYSFDLDFVAPHPILDSISEDTPAFPSRESRVTVIGDNLSRVFSVKVDGQEVPFVLGGRNYLIFTAPSKTPGATAILQVETAVGLSNELSFTYGEAAPTITASSPDPVSTYGETVTLTGSGFTEVTAAVLDGGFEVPFTIVNDTTFTLTMPPMPQGNYDLILCTASDMSDPWQLTSQTPRPAITSLSPNSGTTRGGTVVTLTGTALLDAISVKVDGAEAIFTVNNSTQITFTTPVHTAGSANVTVTTPGGTSTSSTFTYVPILPTNITGVPATYTIGQSLTLTGNVEPSTATERAIIWSVSPLDAGKTRASVSNGIFTATDPGTATVRATIKNGVSATVDYIQDFQIKVAAPSINLTIATLKDFTVTEGKPFTRTVSVTYTGSGTLDYSTTGQPSGVVIDPNTGTISGVADVGTAGSHKVTVTVTDGTLTASTSFMLTVASAQGSIPPVLELSVPNDDTVAEGISYTKTFSITYTGSSTPTYTITGLPGSLSYSNATGRITGVAKPVGAYTIGVTVTDGNLTDTGSFKLTITDGKPMQYTVTVSASPQTGGMVSGGGTFDANNSRTVTATANDGYRFVRWTENGKEMSNSARYTFPLTSNRSLVAHFEATSSSPGSEPTTSTGVSVTNPQTGDHANWPLWASLGALALAGLGGLLVARRRVRARK